MNYKWHILLCAFYQLQLKTPLHWVLQLLQEQKVANIAITPLLFFNL